MGTEKAMVLVRNVVLAISCVVAIAGTAFAEDGEVVSRLSSHGNLSSTAAKKLVSKVNMRMAKSADATANAADPMRAAVSLALFKSPTPPNSMAAAKVRLRLYAGLNEWALEAIFAPQPGVIAGCVREIGASQSECEALVAAAAQSSVASIRRTAGGAAPAPTGYAARPAAPMAPAAGGGNGGRFGRFDSGYRGAAPQPVAPRAAPPQHYGYAQPQQPRFAPVQQQGYQRQGYQPQGYPQQGYQQRPMPQRAAAAPVSYQRPVAPAYRPAAPAAPAVSPQEAQSRKDAYKAQREAYLARQKAAFEERRQKSGAVLASDAAEAPPRDGEDPVAAAAAAVAAAPKSSKPAPKAAEPDPEDVLSAPSEEPAAEVASKGGKAGLDSDFLDGLLADPMGGSKGGKK
jgi:hypothetical protein